MQLSTYTFRTPADISLPITTACKPLNSQFRTTIFSEGVFEFTRPSSSRPAFIATLSSPLLNWMFSIKISLEYSGSIPSLLLFWASYFKPRRVILFDFNKWIHQNGESSIFISSIKIFFELKNWINCGLKKWPSPKTRSFRGTFLWFISRLNNLSFSSSGFHFIQVFLASPSIIPFPVIATFSTLLP